MSRVKLAVCLAAGLALSISVPVAAQPLYNWSGFYGGAHVGKVIGSGEATPFETSPGDGYNGFGDTWTFDVDSGINAGGQVGYNLQRNNLVYGIEVDFGKFGFDGEGPSETSPDTTASSKGGFSTAFRGRLGYASGKYLLYATAGLLNLGAKATVFDDCDTGDCGGGLIDAEGDSRRNAVIFGAGVEYALSTAGRYQISVKAEWLKAAIDDYTVGVSGTDQDGGEQTWDVDTEAPSGTFRVGVNFRFP